MPVGAWLYVQTKKNKKKLSNRVPETTTTQAVPSLSRARTCVLVVAWPYVGEKKEKNKYFKTACQKQPHRPFICSRVPVRAKKKLKKISNREPETTTQAVPSLS